MSCLQINMRPFLSLMNRFVSNMIHGVPYREGHSNGALMSQFKLDEGRLSKWLCEGAWIRTSDRGSITHNISLNRLALQSLYTWAMPDTNVGGQPWILKGSLKLLFIIFICVLILNVDNIGVRVIWHNDLSIKPSTTSPFHPCTLNVHLWNELNYLLNVMSLRLRGVLPALDAQHMYKTSEQANQFILACPDRL